MNKNNNPSLIRWVVLGAQLSRTWDKAIKALRFCSLGTKRKKADWNRERTCPIRNAFFMCFEYEPGETLCYQMPPSSRETEMMPLVSITQHLSETKQVFQPLKNAIILLVRYRRHAVVAKSEWVCLDSQANRAVNDSQSLIVQYQSPFPKDLLQQI